MATDSRRKESEFSNIFSVILLLEGKNAVTLDAKDIIECYFIEDIFKYCITGKITFHDMYGLSEFGPITGNEQIIIAYGADEDRQIVFDMWKMKAVTQTNPSDPVAESLIEIYFVDPTFELYTTARFSRSWSETKITEIISHILRLMVNREQSELDIEESSNSIDFVMPYWTPMEAINWLIKRARSDEIDTSGYLCYNRTIKNNLGFLVSLHSLNYLFSNNVFLEEDRYIFEGNDVVYKNKILDWWTSGIDKHSMKLLKGGHWRGYNFFGKELIDNTYYFDSDVKNTTILGRKSLFPDISDERTSVNISADNDPDLIDNQHYTNFIKRYSIQQALNIIVKGHENRRAGMQIELEWPSTEKKRGFFNKQMKGKYLIKSITHVFTGKASNIPYRQRLVLLKNGYEDSDNRYLLKTTNKNLAVDRPRSNKQYER